MEEWRDVPGFEGKYQISISTKEGKCRRLYKNGHIKELSNTPNKKFKRIYWALSLNGTYKKPQAAYWIAITFPELVQNEWFQGVEIDHIDTDRLNNHPNNLRWVTRKENLNNPITRQHNSEAHKGKVFSEEHRRKIAEANKKRAKKGTLYKASQNQPSCVVANPVTTTTGLF